MSNSGQEASVVCEEGSGWEGSSEKRGSSYVPGEKSGKWSPEEHMNYIAFIDFNKDRMRSREKRRSNKFYQEMADYIITRNALQCRSHHQKLEEKYTHAPKIVNLFKPSFDRTAYRDALDTLQALKRETASEKSIKEVVTEIAQRTVETQTDICGVNLEFVNVAPNCYLIQPSGYRYVPPPQPSLYYSQFFLAPPPPPTTHTLPAEASPGAW